MLHNYVHLVFHGKQLICLTNN